MKLDFFTIIKVLPKVIGWAESQFKEIEKNGLALDDSEMSLAKKVGIKSPERVRVLTVETIPGPDDQELQQLSKEVGLLTDNTSGLTLGYGIYIRQSDYSPRLLSHELRHVYQYEQAGSIAVYLPLYLNQILKYGYDKAPYEIDARNHEN